MIAMAFAQSHRDTEINGITSKIIACAIAVHRALGPGLLERIYEQAMSIEFDDQHVRFQRQAAIPAMYKGRLLGKYFVDFIVEDRVLVEIKSVEHLNPVFEAQLLNYMRITKNPVGLLINFNAPLLKDGITRRAL
jgi:GxxExxY protein